MSEINKIISSVLNEFCSSISPNQVLLEIPVIPEPGSRTGFCTGNVAAKVLRSAGEPLVGWDITWEEDGLMEAECHFIWKSPLGQLIDVTPRCYGESRTLFLPQPGCWDGRSFVPNKRLALEDTPRSRALFMLAAMQDKLKQESWNGYRWTITEEQDQDIRARAAKIVFGVPLWQKCPCFSGKSFGKCCGRPKGRPWKNYSSIPNQRIA